MASIREQLRQLEDVSDGMFDENARYVFRLNSDVETDTLEHSYLWTIHWPVEQDCGHSCQSRVWESIWTWDIHSQPTQHRRWRKRPFCGSRILICLLNESREFPSPTPPRALLFFPTLWFHDSLSLFPSGVVYGLFIAIFNALPRLFPAAWLSIWYLFVVLPVCLIS